jgi:hypothetical protein
VINQGARRSSPSPIARLGSALPGIEGDTLALAGEQFERPQPVPSPFWDTAIEPIPWPPRPRQTVRSRPGPWPTSTTQGQESANRPWTTAVRIRPRYLADRSSQICTTANFSWTRQPQFSDLVHRQLQAERTELFRPLEPCGVWTWFAELAAESGARLRAGGSSSRSRTSAAQTRWRSGEVTAGAVSLSAPRGAVPLRSRGRSTVLRPTPWGRRPWWPTGRSRCTGTTSGPQPRGWTG